MEEDSEEQKHQESLGLSLALQGSYPTPALHSLIQVDVQGSVRVIGVFVVLITGQSILREERDLVSSLTSL